MSDLNQRSSKNLAIKKAKSKRGKYTESDWKLPGRRICFGAGDIVVCTLQALQAPVEG